MIRFFAVLLLGFALFTTLPNSVLAQGPVPGMDLWRDVDESVLASRMQHRVIFPEKYRLVSVDMVMLDNILTQAPVELAPITRDVNITLTLPMPDGSFQRFQLEEAPMMQLQLAQRLPNVKTYRGFGIDDPTAIGYFDRTSEGFHGVIYSDGDTVFIDPYLRGNTVYYQSYYKGDYGNFWNKTFVESGRDEFIHNLIQGKPESQSSARTVLDRVGEVRRTYRMAVAATGEYTQYHGGTVTGAQAAIVTTMNRVRGIFERELSISFVLVDNSDIVFTDPSTDPYQNSSRDLTANQQTIDNIIGSANYDVGHLVGTGGGGLASLGVVCNSFAKARGLTGLRNPVGDPFDVDYVAHEIGHQFGGSHTFNANAASSCTGNRSPFSAFEPGGGTTIQAYAGICGFQNIQTRSDDYFHARSFDQIITHVTSGSGANCGIQTVTNNKAPEVEAGQDFTIPAHTPFMLDGSAIDADNDTLTYGWEEFDLGPAPTSEIGLNALPNTDADGNARPIFRSLKPVTVTHRIFPTMDSIIDGSYSNSGESLPTINRTMQFRLTTRDGRGGVSHDTMNVVVVSNAGPFRVTKPSGATIWQPNSLQTITWDVANTSAAPINCSSVDILLSEDGGNSFPFTLAANTPNDGGEEIKVPVNIISTNAFVKIVCINNIFFDVSGSGLVICWKLLNTDHECDNQAIPELSITHTAPTLVEPGQVINYQIAVKNTGSIALTNLQISSSLPPNVTYKGPISLNSTRAGTIGNPPKIMSGASLLVGQSIIITVPVVVNTGISAGSQIINTATVTSNEIYTEQVAIAGSILLDAPPTLQNDIVHTDEDFAIIIDALANDHDLNGDVLSIRQIGTPIVGHATHDVGRIVYTPANQATTYEDVFTYTVKAGGKSTSSTIRVTVSADDDPPEISNIHNQSIAKSAPIGPISFTISDKDTPLEALTLQASSSNPTLIPSSNITFAGDAANRTVSVSPVAGLSGLATITVTVNDGTSVKSDTFMVAVAVNSPPEFISAPKLSAIVASTYHAELSVVDADSTDALTISTISMPVWLTLTQTTSRTAVLEGLPTSVGHFPIELSVTDGRASATQKFIVSVTEQNHIPIANAGPDKIVNPGDHATLDGSASIDPDGDALSYHWQQTGGLPITFNPTLSRTTFITPMSSSILTFTLTVADHIDHSFIGGSNSDEVVIYVPDLLVSGPPQFTSTPIKVTQPNVPYNYVVTVVDPDLDDSLIISAATKPGWLALTSNSPTTALLSGTPSSHHIGYHPVVLKARDADGLETIHSFSIVVQDTINNIHLPLIIKN